VATHTRTRSLPSELVRKMRSPQMIGVDPPMPGIGSFQAMFWLGPHWAGRLTSLETPFCTAPRHWGQLSAPASVAQAVRRQEADRKVPNVLQRFIAAFLR